MTGSAVSTHIVILVVMSVGQIYSLIGRSRDSRPPGRRLEIGRIALILLPERVSHTHLCYHGHTVALRNQELGPAMMLVLGGLTRGFERLTVNRFESPIVQLKSVGDASKQQRHGWFYCFKEGCQRQRERGHCGEGSCRQGDRTWGWVASAKAKFGHAAGWRLGASAGVPRRAAESRRRHLRGRR